MISVYRIDWRDIAAFRVYFCLKNQVGVVMGPQDSLDFKNIFESVPGSVLVLHPDDPEFTIVAVNHAFEKMTKTIRGNILGHSVFEVFPDDPGEPNPTGILKIRASYRRVMQNRTPDTLAVLKYNIRNPDMDGGAFEERYWSVVNSPVFDSGGSLIYIITQPEDITEFMDWKLRGIKQTQMMDQLQSETARMQSEIFIASKLYTDSQRAIQEREYILSVVANDLKRSVSDIKLATKILAKRDIKSEEIQSVSRNILQSTNIIERLILDLVDFGKIQSGTLLLKKDSESVQEIVNAAMESVIPMALEKGIQLHADLRDTDLRISCDKNRILQVLWSLLVNAIRLTSEKGEVKLKASKRGDYVQFAVTDTGPGLAAEQISKIFDRLWQPDELGEFATGLGLSIVKGIVESHGGQVWLESQIGQGSQFYFTLKALDHTWKEVQPAPKEPSL